MALVGCGRVASRHLTAWQKIPGVRLLAVCDVDEPAARATAERWNIPNFYPRYSEMLDDSKASIIDICVPPKEHASLAVQAFGSGRHVLIEKPMALTSTEASQVLAAQKRSDRKLGVVHNFLFEPAMMKALSMIHRGELGQILNAEIVMVHTDQTIPADKNHWVHSLSGGPFGESLPHPIYLLQALLGRLKLDSVFALKIRHEHLLKKDELHVRVNGDNGSGAIYISYNAPRFMVQLNVYGTRAILSGDLFNASLIKMGAESITFPIITENLKHAYKHLTAPAHAIAKKAIGSWRTGHENYIRAFVREILSDSAPPVSLQNMFDNTVLYEEICSRI